MKKLRTLLLLVLLAVSPLAWSQGKNIFVLAKIMDPVKPLESDYKYGTPLSEALEKNKLGVVTGSGNSMKDKKIEWITIEIELNDAEKGIPFLKKTLQGLGAPNNSVLEYQYLGKSISTPLAP